MEKALDRVPRKVFEWVMRKIGLPEVLVEQVVSQYDGAKTGVKISSELSKEFDVKARMRRQYFCSCVR